MLVELRKACRDGMMHLLFKPAEFLEALAELRPRPGVTCSSTTGAARRTLAGVGRS